RSNARARHRRDLSSAVGAHEPLLLRIDATSVRCRPALRHHTRGRAPREMGARSHARSARDVSLSAMTAIDRDEGLIRVDAGGVKLEGNLLVPDGATGVVLFAHGSGSSRFSSRNRAVAGALRKRGLGTLLIDLLTRDEELVDTRTAHLRFDIELLANRLIGAAEWLAREHANLKIGLFGASTGGGAALVTTPRIPDRISALVSRGGRPE